MTFLDTTVFIDFLSGDEKIVSLMKDLVAKEQIKTTTITEFELLNTRAKSDGMRQKYSCREWLFALLTEIQPKEQSFTV